MWKNLCVENAIYDIYVRVQIIVQEPINTLQIYEHIQYYISTYLCRHEIQYSKERVTECINT